MGPSPIQSIIHTVTVGTMLNFNVGDNGYETTKTLRVNRPLDSRWSNIFT